MVSISYLTETLTSIKGPLTCSEKDFYREMAKFPHLRNLTALEVRVRGLNTTLHPLLQIRTADMPDIYSHQLSVFNTR